MSRHRDDLERDGVATLESPPSAIQLPPERFRTGEPWNEQRIRALAMYCSDGRWGDAFDDFCHRSLQIPRYDRFAVPGGPAWLTAWKGLRGSEEKSSERQANLSMAAWDNLGLLIQAHDLQRIVLVAHYGCAFYMKMLKKDADGVLPVQLDDLKKARAAVKERFPKLSVETYLAMRQGTRMSFHGNV